MSFLVLGEFSTISQLFADDSMELIEQSKEEKKEKEGAEKSIDDIEKISSDELLDYFKLFILNHLSLKDGNGKVTHSQFSTDIIVPPPEQ